MNFPVNGRIGLAAAVLAALSACAPGRPPVPVGTIPQPQVLTPTEEQYGHEVLETLTRKYELDYNHPRYQNLLTVVERLSEGAGSSKDPWHVFLLKDDSFKNAAATRGNHIFVWTGMLNATQDDEELATIVGHEMGHVLAQHTDPDPNESLRQALVQAGAMAAGIAMAQVTGNANMAELASQLTEAISEKVGNAIAVYPFSRERELEADHIGLFLLSEAKYNPESALRFWERAALDPAFSSDLAFFSTHPPAGDRLAQLREFLPQAQARYQARLSGIPASSVQNTDKFAALGANEWAVGPPDSPPLTVGGPQQARRWRVTAPKAYLRSKPSLKSPAIGEFENNAVVKIAERNGSWLRIENPDQGYISANELEPLP